MMRECPYSTKTRGVLENSTPPPPRFPSGFALGRYLGSQKISRASRMDFPIPPSSWWSTDILSSSNFLQVVDQKILPCGQGKIDSVTISPSQLLMRECAEIKNVDIEYGPVHTTSAKFVFFRPPSPLVSNGQHLPGPPLCQP